MGTTLKTRRWTENVVGTDLLAPLEPTVHWWGSGRSVLYALFAPSGFTCNLRRAAEVRVDRSLLTVVEVLELF